MACVTFWNGRDSFLMATFCWVIVSYAALKLNNNKDKKEKKLVESRKLASDVMGWILVMQSKSGRDQ